MCLCFVFVSGSVFCVLLCENCVLMSMSTWIVCVLSVSTNVCQNVLGMCISLCVCVCIREPLSVRALGLWENV